MATAVKTLRDIPQLGIASTDAMCERLLSFLASYQAQHSGATPAWDVIAGQLGIVEEGVRPLVAKLEGQGRLFIISRNPLRLMLTKPGEQNPAEPSAADIAAAKPGAFVRYLDAEGERMRLARFVGATERDKGRGPSLREMVGFVGWAEPARVRRMAETLAAKGVLQFGAGVPTKLTEQGRQVLGFASPPKMEQKMGQKTQKRTLVIVQKGKRPPSGYVTAFCNALAARIRNDPASGHRTHYKDLAVDIGFAPHSSPISAIVPEAVRLGYIQPKPPRHQGLFFTDKGRAKFMPETIEEGMPSGAPVRYEEEPAIKCEEPIVSQVLRATQRSVERDSGLDFDLTSRRLRINGATNSRAELAAFIGKLGALMPFLGE